MLSTVCYFCIMSLKKHILDFYINSSIHVAFAVCAMVVITCLDFGIPVDWDLFWFVFFATITGYNFVKYFGVAKFHHRRLATWLKIIQVFSFFSFVLLCVFTFRLSWETLEYVAIFGVVTFFYAIPFLPKRFFVDSRQNLRSVGGLKVYVIAFVWSGVTVFLPLLNTQHPITFDVYIEGLQRFLIVMALMLPFEIRDLQYDSVKLATIPQQIGVKRTKLLGWVLVAAFFFLEFFKDGLTHGMWIETFLVSIAMLSLILFSKENQKEYYSAFWVESLPIFWALLLLIFKLFLET